MGLQRLFLLTKFIKSTKIENLTLLNKVIKVNLLLIFLYPLFLQCQQSSIIFSKVNFSIYNPAFTGVEGASHVCADLDM